MRYCAPLSRTSRIVDPVSPTEVLQFALIILLALVVGLVIPVLLELRRTLRVVRERIDETTVRVMKSLDGIDATTGHINRFAEEIIASEKEGEGLLAATKEASDALRTLSQGLRKASSIGMAVGPAVAAFLSTLRAMNARPAERDDVDDASTEARRDAAPRDVSGTEKARAGMEPASSSSSGEASTAEVALDVSSRSSLS